MSRRYQCRSCRTAFLSHEAFVGRPIICPKCGADQEPQTGLTPYEGLPAVVVDAPGPEEEDDESVLIPSEAATSARRGRKALLASLALLLVAAVAVALVVAWPTLRRWWHPVPPDPVESVASEYLQSLIDGNDEVSKKLGTIEVPPAIRTFRSVQRDRPRDRLIKGSFAPIAAFHAKIDEEYTYDEAIKRYQPKNALGIAAETLDTLHEAAEKAEQDRIADKIRSGSPDDLFDAAEALAKPYATLAKSVLAPKKLLPTYEMLVDQAKPPLPKAERALVLDYAANPEAWNDLLKRPFLTLKADGPFVLEHAEVVAPVIDKLGSSGDPPTPLRLTLTRFRLEGIDTGWKVTAARREGETPPAEAEDKSEPEESAKPSPGESPGGR